MNNVIGVQHWVLASLLVASAISKWRMPEPSAGRVALVDLCRRFASKVASRASAVAIVRMVGGWEACVAISLVLPQSFVVGRWLALGTSVAAFGYVIWAIVKTPRQSCGCFGTKLSMRSALPGTLVYVALTITVVTGRATSGLAPLWPSALVGIGEVGAFACLEERSVIRRRAQVAYMSLLPPLIASLRRRRALRFIEQLPAWSEIEIATGSPSSSWRIVDSWREGRLWYAELEPVDASRKWSLAISCDVYGPGVRWARASLLDGESRAVFAWNSRTGGRALEPTPGDGHPIWADVG
jgi:hypothetical protein